jgi:hypothetical protein
VIADAPGAEGIVAVKPLLRREGSGEYDEWVRR